MSEEIPIKCNCGRFFEVPAELAGMETVCPGCDTAIRVPRTARLSTAEIPKLKGAADDHDFLAFDKMDQMIEETILDKPITEVIKTQSQIAEQNKASDSQLEVAPDVDERFCPKCRNIIKKNAQFCEKCRSIYCTNCGKGMKIGRDRCPHCTYLHYTPMPEKGWSRKERPFACKHCNALPSEKVAFCYACGKAFKDEKKDAWPAAPTIKSAGNVMASARIIRRHGRDALKMGFFSWVAGFVGVAIGTNLIAPKNELGGTAWILLVWGAAVSLAGRGGWMGFKAYRNPAEEQWSALTSMFVCGAVFLFLLAPHVVLPSVEGGRSEETLGECGENMTVLSEALRRYRADNAGKLPPLDSAKFFVSLSDYLDEKTERLRCPGRRKLNLGYECYEDAEPLPFGILASFGRSFPIAWDIEKNHGSRRNVMFLDGHIAVVEDDEFREMLRNAKDEVVRAREGSGGSK